MAFQQRGFGQLMERHQLLARLVAVVANDIAQDLVQEAILQATSHSIISKNHQL